MPGPHSAPAVATGPGATRLARAEDECGRTPRCGGGRRAWPGISPSSNGNKNVGHKRTSTMAEVSALGFLILLP